MEDPEANTQKQIVRDGYNRCAKDYTVQRDRFKSEQHLNELLRHLPAGPLILDAGCGAGVPVAQYLLGRGCRVIGVDISQEQVELARQNCPAGRFTCADMTGFCLPQASLDAIVSFYAIIHIPRAEHAPLLARFMQILRQGGYLLATLGAIEWEGIEAFHGVPMFWSHYGREENLALLREAGFEVRSEKVDDTGDEQHLVVLARKPT